MFAKKRIISVILSFVMVIGMCATTFADSSTTMTMDEAKEYLINYEVTKINELGKEYTTKYIFKSEGDLNKAATYISEHGLDAFNDAVDDAIADAVSNEPESTLVVPRTTTPATAYRTISGNGNHKVSAVASGFVSFDTLGNIEYLVELGYTVTVKNGKITNLSNISFNVSQLPPTGSYGNLKLPSHYTNTNCGVTANYTITKSVGIEIAGFPIEIKSETVYEIFPLLTSLK